MTKQNREQRKESDSSSAPEQKGWALFIGGALNKSKYPMGEQQTNYNSSSQC